MCMLISIKENLENKYKIKIIKVCKINNNGMMWNILSDEYVCQ